MKIELTNIELHSLWNLYVYVYLLDMHDIQKTIPNTVASHLFYQPLDEGSNTTNKIVGMSCRPIKKSLQNQAAHKTHWKSLWWA